MCSPNEEKKTLGLDLSRCFGDDIPKCVKNDVLFSHNFDWNLLNGEFSENNVEALNIKCAIVLLNCFLHLILFRGRACIQIISFFSKFSNKHCYYIGDSKCHSKFSNHI